MVANGHPRATARRCKRGRAHATCCAGTMFAISTSMCFLPHTSLRIRTSPCLLAQRRYFAPRSDCTCVFGVGAAVCACRRSRSSLKRQFARRSSSSTPPTLRRSRTRWRLLVSKANSTFALHKVASRRQRYSSTTRRHSCGARVPPRRAPVWRSVNLQRLTVR